MSFGKWSDRMGGEDQPYEYVDLYDSETGRIFTWSIPEDLETRPSAGDECVIDFTVEQTAKPALTEVKRGARKGETMPYVAEKIRCKVVAFRPAQPQAQPQGKPAAKAA